MPNDDRLLVVLCIYMLCVVVPTSSLLLLYLQSDKTALHLAAQNGHADAIRALVDCGADVSILSKVR